MTDGRLLALTLLALLAGCGASDRARLPPAPFELRATPASVVEGGAFTLSLVPKPGDPVDVGPVDLYVSFVQDAGRAWAYLDPSGRWTQERVPYRRIDGARPSRVSVSFGGVSPFGQFSFRAQFVPPGTAPSRKHYVLTPLVARVAISPAPRDADRPGVLVGALGALTAAALALVMALPGTRRSGQREG